MDRQKTRYAKSGSVHVAYQVLGDGPTDLVYVQGAFTHLDVMWELPAFRRFCEQLASFSRLIWFDKRGMGLSDRVPAGTLEERMDDVRAVMDAAGSGRAVLLGESEGGPLSLLFAAAHPERAEALVLCGAEVKERADQDWPRAKAPPRSSSRTWRREFVTGAREPAEPDRVLATVLFTDIVASTEHASRLGDRRRRDLVSEHHDLIRLGYRLRGPRHTGPEGAARPVAALLGHQLLTGQ